MKDRNMQQQSAIIAGISLLIMAIAAAFSFGYIHNTLVVSGDALATMTNIRESGSLFQLGILGWVVIIISDLLVSWSFYVYLKSIHREYSLLAGWLRILYTAILAMAVSHLVIVDQILREDSSLFEDSMEVMASQVMLSITAFESIWSLGLIVFGVHLMAVGFVAMKARQIPKLVSFLLLAAGFSYTLIHFLDRFVPQLDGVLAVLEIVLMIPMILGELGFGIWLLLEGRKNQSIH